MNIKIKFSVILMAVVLCSTSCNKYLTLEPQDGIIRQNFWKTKEQLAAAVNGCYASLLQSPLVQNLFLWGELRADMLAPGTGTPSTLLDVMNVNINSSNPITDWSSVYRTINNCNTVLDFAPSVLTTDKTLTQQSLNSYMGEARALRALMYFYLARTFGDVPLKLKSTTSDGDNLQIPKSTQQEVFTQIETDLKQAETEVVKTYGSRDLDKGRITYYTVEAMLADLYLWTDQYDKSITACDNIINSHQFSLVPGDSNWFTTLFYQGNSAESIFEFQFGTDGGQQQNPFYDLLAQSSKVFKAATWVAPELYTIDDLDLTDVDIRGDGAALKFSDGSIYKYQGINSTSTRSSSASYAHWFVYRYADILLMKAEALNQQGDGQGALDLIQTIRDRAHALTTSAMVVQPDDKDGITDYLLAERGREFAFEGKRWYDLLRNARRNNYARLDLLLNVVSLSAALDYQGAAIVKYRDVRSHYLPINLSELQADKALVQNPFYQ